MQSLHPRIDHIFYLLTHLDYMFVSPYRSTGYAYAGKAVGLMAVVAVVIAIAMVHCELWLRPMVLDS